mgnify:CR=1 FL=1
MTNLPLIVSRHQQALESTRQPISIQARIRRLFSICDEPTQFQKTSKRAEPYLHIQESAAAVPRPIGYFNHV